MTLEAFGVKNLRCLTDTGLIPIRPITVLVGRNSSGKSTFLRAFPLLRQSVEAKRNSPILWGDDESYVDFGSFLDAANNRLNEPSVTFQFRLQVHDHSLEIAMSLAGGQNPYASAYDIMFDGYRARWAFDADGLAHQPVGGETSFPQENPGSVFLGGQSSLFPQLRPSVARPLPTRTAEALVPLSIFRVVFSRRHGDSRLDAVNALSRLATTMSTDGWRHVHLKDGMKLYQVKNPKTAEEGAHWLEIARRANLHECPSPCTTRKECSCVVVDALGGKALADVVAWLRAQSSKRQLAEDFNFAGDIELKALADEILAFGLALPPLFT